MKHLPLKIIIEKTPDGYSAYAEQLNVFSVGNDLQQIKNNILEAVNMFLEEENTCKKINKIDLDFILASTELA